MFYKKIDDGKIAQVKITGNKVFYGEHAVTTKVENEVQSKLKTSLKYPRKQLFSRQILVLVLITAFSQGTWKYLFNPIRLLDAGCIKLTRENLK